MRNPAYCGIVTVPANQKEEIQWVKGVHEPIISKSIFHDVQLVLQLNRRLLNPKMSRNYLFPLRGSWYAHIATNIFREVFLQVRN